MAAPSKVTFEDYLWTEHAGAFQAFCLTYIEDSSVDAVLGTLPVLEYLGELSFDELVESSYDDWRPEAQLVGLFKVDEVVMMYEVNGFVGLSLVANAVLSPLPNGRLLVSHHFSDGNGHGTVRIMRDGRVLGDFDPRAASQFEILHVNYGLDERETGELLDKMDAVGFDRGEKSDGSPTQQHNRAAAFALSQLLTGVCLTADTLTSIEFRTVRVSMSAVL